MSAEPAAPPAPQGRPPGSPLEVLVAFGRLGFSAFGGPVAHLGYFREEFVTRRGWLDEAAYADLVALCQLLPGPASSQVAIALGLFRAGAGGAVAAWCAFTLPSVALLLAFAHAAPVLLAPAGAGILHGLQLVAVAVVAQAVVGMARSLCPDRARASIACAALVIVLLGGGSVAQILAIVGGALAGLALCRGSAPAWPRQLHVPVSARCGAAALVAFLALLAFLPLAHAFTHSQTLAMFDAFYRSGALVFGGGHVVLPLLRDAVVAPGWISDRVFLAGYGAAQAVPGPLFSFAAYLGSLLNVGPGGIRGGLLALAALYLPGILVLIGALPFWQAFRGSSRAQASLAGINAAVVGVLAAALYDPIWTTAVRSRGDFVVAAVGFVLLIAWRTPPLVVVLGSAVAGVLLDAFAL
jgi:chromate transporter